MSGRNVTQHPPQHFFPVRRGHVHRRLPDTSQGERARRYRGAQFETVGKVRTLTAVNHILVEAQKPSVVNPGSTWGQLGFNLGSTWGQPGINPGSTWDQSAPPYHCDAYANRECAAQHTPRPSRTFTGADNLLHPLRRRVHLPHRRRPLLPLLRTRHRPRPLVQRISAQPHLSGGSLRISTQTEIEA